MEKNEALAGGEPKTREEIYLALDNLHRQEMLGAYVPEELLLNAFQLGRELLHSNKKEETKEKDNERVLDAQDGLTYCAALCAEDSEKFVQLKKLIEKKVPNSTGLPGKQKKVDKLLKIAAKETLKSNPASREALEVLAKEIFSDNKNDLEEEERLQALSAAKKLEEISDADAEMSLKLGEYFSREEGKQKEGEIYYKKAVMRMISGKKDPKEIWQKALKIDESTASATNPTSLTRISLRGNEDFFTVALTGALGFMNVAPLYQILIEAFDRAGMTKSALFATKRLLAVDKGNSWARKVLAKCYTTLFSKNPSTPLLIEKCGVAMTGRSAFDAINEFERRIRLVRGTYVKHNTNGLGRIISCDDERIKIRFLNGQEKTMTQSLAMETLKILRARDWEVIAATTKKDTLRSRVLNHPQWAILSIVEGVESVGGASLKDLKDRLCGTGGKGILTTSEWNKWLLSAKKTLSGSKYELVKGKYRLKKHKAIFNSADSVSSNSKDTLGEASLLSATTKDKKGTSDKKNTLPAGRVNKGDPALLSNLVAQFQAAKKFSDRVEIGMRIRALLPETPEDRSSIAQDAAGSIANYFKSFFLTTTKNENLVTSYLILRLLGEETKLSFDKIYKTYGAPSILSIKNKALKEQFLKEVATLDGWEEEYLKLFSFTLDENLILKVVQSGYDITNAVDKWFNNPGGEAVTLFGKDYIKLPLARQKTAVRLVADKARREIKAHVRSVDNKKLLKRAEELLKDKTETNDNVTEKIKITPAASQTNSRVKGATGNAPSKNVLLVSNIALKNKRARAEEIETRLLPEVAREIDDARQKGDLKENAEFHAAKEAQRALNREFMTIQEELSRAQVAPKWRGPGAGFGAKVFIKRADGTKESLKIEGPWESSAATGEESERIVSYLAPLGEALMGSVSGSVIDFRGEKILVERVTGSEE